MTEERSVRFQRCRICGQDYDTTDLDHVFHHDGEAHEPLPPNDEAAEG